VIYYYKVLELNIHSQGLVSVAPKIFIHVLYMNTSSNYWIPDTFKWACYTDPNPCQAN